MSKLRSTCAFSDLTLLVGRQEGHPVLSSDSVAVFKSRLKTFLFSQAFSLLTNTEWWGAGVVVCLERGTDLHTAQLMPLLVTVSCFSKIQLGFTFLVPAYPGSTGQTAVKLVCVCMYTGQPVLACTSS